MAQQITEAPAQERRLRMTYDEFLALDDHVHAEWVDGEVTIFVPPSELHQDIVLFLAVLVGGFARRLGLGKVMAAPFEMRSIVGRSSREPDLLFIALEHRDRMTGKRLEGPADLVIEVISDTSATRDRREKFAEYQRIGVPEYWIVDARPGRFGTEFFRLAAGIYQPAHPDADGRYHPAVLPGFWLRPDWLWQDPMPDPIELLEEIAPRATAAGRQPTNGQPS